MIAVSSTGASSVVRRAGLTRREFVSEYERPCKPVVLTGALDDWPATTTWTLDFFRERYGSRSVTIDGRSYRFADFIDLVMASTAAEPAPYFRNIRIEEWAPELLPDILPLPRHTKPNWLDSRFFPERPSLTSVELYIGGAGASFPVLHYDNLHTHAFLMLLHGSKEYLVYGPDQSHLLYPRAGHPNKSSIEDLERPDLERFPLFARAAGQRFVVRAGEMLFVPAGWWHTARILEPSITVSANTVNATNWTAFAHDYVASLVRNRSKSRASLVGAYMRLFGLIATLVSTW